MRDEESKPNTLWLWSGERGQINYLVKNCIEEWTKHCSYVQIVDYFQTFVKVAKLTSTWIENVMVYLNDWCILHDMIFCHCREVLEVLESLKVGLFSNILYVITNILSHASSTHNNREADWHVQTARRLLKLLRIYPALLDCRATPLSNRFLCPTPVEKSQYFAQLSSLLSPDLPKRLDIATEE